MQILVSVGASKANRKPMSYPKADRYLSAIEGPTSATTSVAAAWPHAS